MTSISQPYSCFSLFLGDKELELYQPIAESGIVDGDELELRPKNYTYAESVAHLKRAREVFGFTSVNPFPVVDAGLAVFPNIESKVLESVPKKPDQKQTLKGPNPLAAYEEDFASATVKNSQYTSGIDLASKILPCVDALQLSQWNPVPAPLQLRGDLYYLYLVTLEKKTFHITSARKGFFVCNSSSDKFDPSPRKINGKYHEHASLISLVRSLSPLANKQLNQNETYVKTLNRLALVNATNSFLSTPWLVSDKKNYGWGPDSARSQTALESGSSARDWNQDLQTMREQPNPDENGDITVQERILRERMLNKLSFDFSEASLKGAINIAHGNIEPLNPEDPLDSYIFLQDGIFYFFASDGVGSFTEEGGDAAARYSAGKDLAAINVANGWDLPGVNTLWTVIVDYLGRRIVCQSPVPGIFSESASNESQIAYGSMDNRNSVVAEKDYEVLMQKIADQCHLKRHKSYGADGSDAELVVSAETKGLTGTDGRKYIFDLYRTTPLDILFTEQNFKTGDSDSYPHAISTLRPEAINSWFMEKIRELRAERTKKSADTKDETEPEKTQEELAAEAEEIFSEVSKSCRFNPDVGAKDEALVPEKDLERFRADQAEVRVVCSYVQETLIPGLVSDILNGVASVPLDGALLTSVLHSRGINMRYIGLVHKVASNHGALLESFIDLLEQEAVSRSVKHLLNSSILGAQPEDLTAQVVSFLNKLFTGNEEVRAQVKHEVRKRFRFNLNDLFWARNKNFVSLFRDISLKSGLQWKNKKIDFSVADPISADDLVNIAPIVRATTFRSKLAQDANEAGRMYIREGNNETALQLVSESLNIYEQVYGVIHPEVARAYINAAMFYKDFEDYATACDLCRRSVIISERTLGLDSGETIFAYMNWSLFEFYRGNCLGGLEILQKVLKYSYLFVGQQSNPHLMTIIGNIGAMFQSLDQNESAVKWFELNLKNALAVYGKDIVPTDGTTSSGSTAKDYQISCSFQLGSAYYQVAKALIGTKDYHEASRNMQLAHNIFNAAYGSENENTIDCKNWLKSLVEAAVSVAKMQRAHPQLAKMAQQAPVVAKEGTKASKKEVPGSFGDRDINELVNYINGTGSAKNQKKKKSKK